MSRCLRLALVFLTSVELIGQQPVVTTKLVRAQNVQGIQESKENSKCTAALQAAQDKIKDGRSVTIQSIEKYKVAERYEDYPQDRPYEYVIIFFGPAFDSILSSVKFLTAISTDIVKDCESVSMVTVGEPEVYAVWGLKENGKVELFTECPERPITKKLRWGQVFCHDY